MLDQYFILNQIKSAITDYELATNVNCYLFDKTGKKVGNRSCYECANICSFVKPFDRQGICVYDYICNSQQALVTTDAHFYLCPYGLLNITIPIFLNDDSVYFASTGPILIHAPNKYIINRFMDQNELIHAHYDDVKMLLSEVPLKDNSHLMALSNTLQRSVQSYADSTSQEVSSLNKQKNIGNVIAALKSRMNQNVYSTYNEAYYVLEKEIEMLAGKSSPQSKKALDMILNRFIDNIHRDNIFEVSKYRGEKFFYSLLRIAKSHDLNLETIFGKHCFLISELLETKDNEHLNAVLYSIIPRFQKGFWAGSVYQINEIIMKSLDYIQSNYAEITLQDVAQAVSLNPSYLSELFKKEVGQTYSDYVNQVRINVSKQYLRDEMPLSQIAQAVGFTDQSYFTKIFKRYEGISPSRWKK